MNRGSGSVHLKPRKIRTTFNEAPIHESGKFGHGGVDDDGQPAFNEAPIHESGKFVMTQGVEEFESPFNEAPIHESGKYSSTH